MADIHLHSHSTLLPTVPPRATTICGGGEIRMTKVLSFYFLFFWHFVCQFHLSITRREASANRQLSSCVNMPGPIELLNTVLTHGVQGLICHARQSCGFRGNRNTGRLRIFDKQQTGRVGDGRKCGMSKLCHGPWPTRRVRFSGNLINLWPGVSVCVWRERQHKRKKNMLSY